MSDTNDTERAWDIVEKIKTCMLTTLDAGHLRARPMHAYASRDEGCLWFLTDMRNHKDDELRADPRACLSFASAEENAYVSVSGSAEVFQDTRKAEELWSPFASAWWPDGPTDPDVRILRFDPEFAEFWDGPSSSVVIAFKLARARATDQPPDLGENRKVSMG